MKIISHSLRFSATTLFLSLNTFGIACATGFGNAVLLSRLGEPLHAEVALEGDSTSVEDSCLSLLPPPAGQETAYLGKARLSLRTANGQRYVVIRSSQAIDTPFINIRLRLQCPGTGSLEKTLTFLPDLDTVPQPPVTAAAAPAPEPAHAAPAPAAAERTTAKPHHHITGPARVLSPAPRAVVPESEAPFTFRLSSELPDLSRIGKPVAQPRPEAPPAEGEGLQLKPAQLEELAVSAPSVAIPKTRPASVVPPPSQLDNLDLQRLLAIAGLLLAVLVPLLGWRRYMRGRPQRPGPASSPASTQQVVITQGDTRLKMLEEAELYAIHGHPEKATAILQETVRQHPDDEEAWVLLFSIYSAHGQKQEFENSAHTFRQLHPHSASWKMIKALGRTIDKDNPLYDGDDALGAAAAFLPHIALSKHRLVGNILVEMGFLSEHELEEWLAGFDPKRHGRFGNYLVSRRVISHRQLNAALLKQQEDNAGKPAGGLPTLQDVEGLIAGFDPQRDGNLGEYLVSRNMISAEQLDQVLHRQGSPAAQPDADRTQ